jgi:ribosomal protein S18 acetylase RimI-like enzyme
VALQVREVSGYQELERWVSTRNDAWPDKTTVEMTALLRATELEHVDLLALEDGEPVGTAFLSGDPRSVETRRPYIEITVPEPDRGRGIGSALLAAVSEYAVQLGHVGLRCSARADDAHSVGFLERRGFRETRRSHELELDLESARAPESSGAGEIVWLADRIDALTDMYDVARDAAAKRADFLAGFVRSEEEWRVYELGTPLVHFELTALAVADGCVRAYSIAQDVPDERSVYHRSVAIAPDWEERGLGEALIAAQIARAREAGVRSLVALPWVERLEQFFLGLGYESRATWLELEGPLVRA